MRCCPPHPIKVAAEVECSASEFTTRKEEKSPDKEILHQIKKLLESYLALFFHNILKIKLEVTTLNSVCPHLNSSLDLPMKFFQLHALYISFFVGQTAGRESGVETCFTLLRESCNVSAIQRNTLGEQKNVLCRVIIASSLGFLLLTGHLGVVR